MTNTAERAIAPHDPVAAAIDVYNRTASSYATAWDGYTTPALARFVQELAPGAAVLDAGCGPGRDLAALRSHGLSPVGVDLSTAMVTLARKTGRAVVGDLRNLQFHDAAFAGVWASAALVHLPADDAAAALAELARVTRPGGAAHVTVKAVRPDGTAAGYEGEGEDARWFQYWTPADFIAAATDSGWAGAVAAIEPDSRRPNVRWVTATLTR